MAQATKFSTAMPTATMPAKISDVAATSFAPVLWRTFMESTTPRGMLRRQRSHLRDVRNGMPDTESDVMTTACHFSPVPLLQINTASVGFMGVGCSRRGFQCWAQPTASTTNARSETCSMQKRRRRRLMIREAIAHPSFHPGDVRGQKRADNQYHAIQPLFTPPGPSGAQCR